MTEITQDNYDEIVTGAILIAQDEGVESYEDFRAWMNRTDFELPVSEQDYRMTEDSLESGYADEERARDLYREFTEL